MNVSTYLYLLLFYFVFQLHCRLPSDRRLSFVHRQKQPRTQGKELGKEFSASPDKFARLQFDHIESD